MAHPKTHQTQSRISILNREEVMVIQRRAWRTQIMVIDIRNYRVFERAYEACQGRINDCSQICHCLSRDPLPPGAITVGNSYQTRLWSDFEEPERKRAIEAWTHLKTARMKVLRFFDIITKGVVQKSN